VEGELGAKEKVISEALSHINTIVTTSDQREELQKRVRWVELIWRQTPKLVTDRLAQLIFEKHQMVI